MKFIMVPILFFLFISCTKDEKVSTNASSILPLYSLKEIEALKPEKRPRDFLVETDNYTLIMFGDNNQDQRVSFGPRYEIDVRIFGAAEKLEIFRLGKLIRSWSYLATTSPHLQKVVFQEAEGDLSYGSNTYEFKAWRNGQSVTSAFEIEVGSLEVREIRNKEIPEFSYTFESRDGYELCTLDFYPQDYSMGIPLYTIPKILPFYIYIIDAGELGTIKLQHPVATTEEQYQKTYLTLFWYNPKLGIETSISTKDLYIAFSKGLKIKFFPDGSWLLKGSVAHEGNANYLWASAQGKTIVNMSQWLMANAPEKVTAPWAWDFQDGKLIGEQFGSPWGQDPEKKEFGLFEMDPNTMSLVQMASRKAKDKEWGVFWLKDRW